MPSATRRVPGRDERGAREVWERTAGHLRPNAAGRSRSDRKGPRGVGPGDCGGDRQVPARPRRVVAVTTRPSLPFEQPSAVKRMGMVGSSKCARRRKRSQGFISRRSIGAL